MTEDAVRTTSGKWRWLVAVGVLSLAVGVSGGLLAGTGLTQGDSEEVPPPGSADVEFARDMQTHHAQAVEMSTILRERTDDAETRTLALDIALTQQQQIGQMYAWLDTWGYPQSSAGSSAASGSRGSDDGQSANGHHDRMPGMATPAQLRRLADSAGREAEVLFLRLMIDHHRGGVRMAENATDRAERPQVRRLARQMLDAQQSEIAAMRQMMQARTDPPE